MVCDGNVVLFYEDLLQHLAKGITVFNDYPFHYLLTNFWITIGPHKNIVQSSFVLSVLN